MATTAMMRSRQALLGACSAGASAAPPAGCKKRCPPLRGRKVPAPRSGRAAAGVAGAARLSRAAVYGAVQNEESYTLELTEENVETVLDEVRPFSPALPACRLPSLNPWPSLARADTHPLPFFSFPLFHNRNRCAPT